jgi:hypothetical protein
MNLLRKAYSKIKRTAAKTSDKIIIPKTPSQIKFVLTSFLPTEPMTQPKIPYTPFSNPQPHSIVYRNPFVTSVPSEENLPTVPTRSTPTRRHFVRKARNRQALAEEIEEKTRELVEQGVKVRDFQAEADAEKEQEWYEARQNPQAGREQTRLDKERQIEADAVDGAITSEGEESGSRDGDINPSTDRGNIEEAARFGAMVPGPIF